MIAVKKKYIKMLKGIQVRKRTNRHAALYMKLRKPISIMFKIKFTSYYLAITTYMYFLVITKKDLVITRKLSCNYEKRSRNISIIIS